MSFNELKKAKEVFGVKVKMSKKTHTKKNKSEDSISDTEEELYEGVDSKKSDNILCTSKLGGNKLQKSSSRRGTNSSSSSSRSSMQSGKKRNKVSSSDDENVSYLSTILEDEDSNEM